MEFECCNCDCVFKEETDRNRYFKEEFDNKIWTYEKTVCPNCGNDVFAFISWSRFMNL